MRIYMAIGSLWLSTTAPAAFHPLKIATGSFHTCVLSKEGEVKCWGYNGNGELGTGDTVSHGAELQSMGAQLPVANLGLTDGEKASDICTGYQFSCAATNRGHVKCWGRNYSGQLGQGLGVEWNNSMGQALPFTDLGKDFHVKALSCGETRVCARSDSGVTKCWGQGYAGGLGLGDETDRGHLSSEMGDLLPAISKPGEMSAVSVGADHVCAQYQDNVRCWGAGFYGQTGYESKQMRGNTPDSIPSLLPGVSLKAVQEEKILSISSGALMSCALMTKESSFNNIVSFVKCWGYNGAGFLGVGSRINHGLDSKTMGANLPSVSLGMSDIVEVQAHAVYACARSKNGRVKCWGYNASGRLGLEDFDSRGEFLDQMGEHLPFIDLGLPAKALSVGADSSHSCAILINDEIKCWGEGAFGKLGYESTDDVGGVPGQMGDGLPFVNYK